MIFDMTYFYYKMSNIYPCLTNYLITLKFCWTTSIMKLQHLHDTLNINTSLVLMCYLNTSMTEWILTIWIWALIKYCSVVKAYYYFNTMFIFKQVDMWFYKVLRFVYFYNNWLFSWIKLLPWCQSCWSPLVEQER